MLAYGLKDPYSRFITPTEFQAMRKYDVTGVGLNLATAEEFTKKSGMSLPEDRNNAEARLLYPYGHHFPQLLFVMRHSRMDASIVWAMPSTTISSIQQRHGPSLHLRCRPSTCLPVCLRKLAWFVQECTGAATCGGFSAIAVPPQGGVWVLGMIKGGAADGAGIRQGDEILRVDGQDISSLSPFKVAGLLQGADSDSDSDSFVELEVRAVSVSLLCCPCRPRI